MTIRAKYKGYCGGCGKPIPAGATVDWDKATRQIFHPSCVAALKEPAPHTFDFIGSYPEVLRC